MSVLVCGGGCDSTSDKADWDDHDVDDRGNEVPSGPLCAACGVFCKKRGIYAADLVNAKTASEHRKGGTSIYQADSKTMIVVLRVTLIKAKSKRLVFRIGLLTSD